MAKKLLNPTPAMKEQDWRAEDDHRTLQRAAEVTSDKARMKAVAQHHQKVTRDLGKMSTMLGTEGGQDARTAKKPTLRKRRIVRRGRARI